MRDKPSLFDDELLPGLSAQLPTQKVQSVRQSGGMGEEKEGSSPYHPWREVPQALFLSWSVARQFDYCARRDRDAARSCLNQKDAAWYLERALSYMEMVAWHKQHVA